MGFGIGIGISPTLGTGVGGDLLSLFRNGEDGFLFGPFDTFERMLLLSNGSSGNVAADSDPVGLNLDRHSWGQGVSLTAILAAQPELLIAGSWTMSVAGGTSTATESPSGTLNLTGDGTNAARGDQSFSTVVGKTYRITATTSVTTSVQVGTTQGGASIVNGSLSSGASIYFVATATTTWVRFTRSAASLSVVSAISLKLVPGNHSLQATTTKRPFWKANSGKPLLRFDGTDDALGLPYAPGAAGTVAIAFNASTVGDILTGGATVGNKRVRLGLDGAGQALFTFNDQFTSPIAGDRRNTNIVMAMTWGSSGHRMCYLNGALVLDEARAANQDGTGTFAINAGTVAADVFATLARSAESTPSEIALITSTFQGAYQ